MRSVTLTMIFLVMLLVAAPVFAGDVLQMWKCEMDDEADEEMVEAHAAEWLAEAKKVDGGANIEAHVLFPIAVNATGEMDIMFIVTAPSFTEWGKFWDAYPDSDAADIEEDASGLIVCPDSVLWEKVTIE